MAGLKKNLLISISTALLGVVVLFAFDNQIWISIKNLIPPDFICITKVLTKWGLYVFYSIFAGLLIYLTHVSTDFLFGGVLTLGTDVATKKAKIGDINWVSVIIGIVQIALGVWFVILAAPGLIAAVS